MAAACLLLAGGAAWAVSASAPMKSSIIAPADEWVMTPASGTSTPQLPNTPDNPCQIISFTYSGLDGNADYVDQSKVAVTYAGKEVRQVRYPRDEEPGEDSNGFNAQLEGGYNGINVIVNYQVFSEPGELVINLAEGAVVDFDRNLSPAMTFTRSYGKAGEKSVSVKDFKPTDGSKVKTLSNVTVFFDLTTLEDEQILCDASKAAEIKLTKAGSETGIAAQSVAYDESIYVAETIPYTITFPEVTEDGEYTLTIPAGFFWAAATEGEKPAGALESKEITAKYTVDSSVKGPFEDYIVIEPEQAPAEISALESVSIQFPQLEQVFCEEAALTKDGIASGYEVYCGKDWNYGMNTIKLTFTIDGGDDEIIRENGLYEITIPSGAVKYGDQSNNEPIVLSFKVNADKPVEYAWETNPANGGKIDMPSENADFIDFKFIVNGAEEVDTDSEWTAPDYDPNEPGGNHIKSMTVTYNDKNIARVVNASGDAVENIGYQVRNGWDGNDFYIRINKAVFTRPGVLKINIDKGLFLVDGANPSPVLAYSCTVGEIPDDKEFETEVLPKMEIDKLYSLSDFDVFTVKFTNAKSAVLKTYKDLDDNDKPVELPEFPPHLGIGAVIYYGACEIQEVADAECPTFTFKFTEIAEYDNGLGGWLNFSLDEGMFTLDGKYDSPAVSQTWNLERTQEIDTSYTPSPQGDIVNQGYGLYPAFAFNNEETINYNWECEVKFNGEVITGDVAKPKIQNWAISFELDTEEFKNPELTGVLEINIPAGAVKISGVPLEAISHTWNIVLPKEFTYHFTPEFISKGSDAEIPAASDLSEIIVDIPDAKSVSVWNNNYINLRSRDYFTYGAKAPVSTEVITIDGHPAVKMNFSPAPEADTIYELAFNYGALYIDNAYECPPMDYVVRFDKAMGVELIPSDADGEYTVYTLDGKLVAKGGFDLLKSLDKGVYIVNGKKIAL